MRRTHTRLHVDETRDTLGLALERERPGHAQALREDGQRLVHVDERVREPDECKSNPESTMQGVASLDRKIDATSRLGGSSATVGDAPPQPPRAGGCSRRSPDRQDVRRKPKGHGVVP